MRIFLLSVIAIFGVQLTAQAEPTIDDLLEAMIQVESNNNPNKVGDNGESFGPLQIQYPYWLDARMPYGKFRNDPDHNDVLNKVYAKEVVTRYWKRYCPKALELKDLKTLARVHNGGPRGAQKESTLKYWELVKIQLNRRTH